MIRIFNRGIFSDSRMVVVGDSPVLSTNDQNVNHGLRVDEPLLFTMTFGAPLHYEYCMENMDGVDMIRIVEPIATSIIVCNDIK